MTEPNETAGTTETAAVTEPTAVAGTTDAAEPVVGTTAPEAPEANPHETRRQVLYWRLLAQLFDPEEQPALESSSLAVVKDIGLPPALLDPKASVDSVVQRHPELADTERVPA